MENLRRKYVERGHRVTVVTTHQDEGQSSVRKWEDEFGQFVSIFNEYPEKIRHRYCVNSLALQPALHEILSEIQPDVIHVHNVHQQLTYNALVTAKQVTDRIFVTLHDTFSVSFARVKEAGYFSSLRSGKGFRMHWWHHLFAAGRKYWPLRNRRIRKIFEESVTKLVPVSGALETFLHANGIRNTCVIHNGIEIGDVPSHDDVSAFKVRYDLTGPTLMFAGRIREDKGIAALLNAFEIVLEKHPNAKLLVVGEQKQIDFFLRSRAQKIVDAVRTTGWIRNDQMCIAYAAADIVVTPSVYLDNFPTVNLEAFVAGKPVVGTIFGGTPEIVSDGITGFTCDPRQRHDLSQKILRLLNDSVLCENFGKEAQKEVVSNFSLDRQADAYLALFENQTA